MIDIFPDDLSRDAAHNGVLGYIFYHNGVGTDDCIVADGDLPQDLCSGADGHAVADDGGLRCKGIANGNLLIDPAVAADAFGGNDCGKSVLQEKAAPKLGSVDGEVYHPGEEKLCNFCTQCAFPPQSVLQQCAVFPPLQHQRTENVKLPCFASQITFFPVMDFF